MNEEKGPFAAWVEAHEPPKKYDILDWVPPWHTPDYVEETIEEPVEPYYSQMKALTSQLPYDCPECGGPEPEFYLPTARLLQLELDISDLEPRAWRTVPNPNYDPERAAAWREKRRFPYDQTTITIGQSYAPDPA